MIAYGTISRGQKVTVIKGAGFSFTLYENTGKKNKTPQASGVGEAEVKNYVKTYNTMQAGVKRNFDVRA